jgi:pyruvate formate lyase activating enzyme
VLATCIKMKQAGVHVEVTNLIIPGENDTDGNFLSLRDWVHENLGPDTPVHLSAYHPMYKFTAPPTPVSTMERALGIVREKLPYAYLGNVYSDTGADTKCQSCGKYLVRRSGYRIDTSGLARTETGTTCAHCATPAPFVT